MNKNILFTILLVALLIISGVQAYQVNDIKQDVSNGELTIDEESESSSSSASTNGVSLNDLPTMVGGC